MRWRKASAAARERLARVVRRTRVIGPARCVLISRAARIVRAEPIVLSRIASRPDLSGAAAEIAC